MRVKISTFKHTAREKSKTRKKTKNRISIWVSETDKKVVIATSKSRSVRIAGWGVNPLQSESEQLLEWATLTGQGEKKIQIQLWLQSDQKDINKCKLI